MLTELSAPAARTPTMPSPGRLPGLDTLRACAIVAVMLFHLSWLLPQSLSPVARFGWMGVDLFFVLSGYLIAAQLFRPYTLGEAPSLSAFYLRRAFRILPAYLVVLALYFLVPAWREDAGISPLWQFLTFTENLFVDYSIHQAFSHVWSLCVEEHFYLVLPLLVVAMMRPPSARKTVAVLAAVLVWGIAARAFILVHALRPIGEDNFAVKYIEDIYYPTYTRLDGLLAGVSLALLQAFRPDWWAGVMRRGHLTLVAGLAVVSFAAWLFASRFESLTGVGAWGTVVGFPVLSVGFGLLVASSVSQTGLLSRLRIPGARLLAMLAFTLYLTHKAVAHLDRQLLPKLTADRDWSATLVYGVSCLLAAALLHVSVERPCLRLRDRLNRQGSDGARGAEIEDKLQTDPAL